MKNIIIYSLFILAFSSCRQSPNALTETQSKASKINAEFHKNNKNDLLAGTTATNTKECSPFRIQAYLNDSDNSGTNIRKTPAGEILLKLQEDDLNFTFYFILTEVKEGWFKIESPIIGMDSDIEVPNGEAWIHGSLLSVGTRNYGGEHLKLLDKPEDGNTVSIIKNDFTSLTLKDVCGEWVQVEHEKSSGWIESKWLCGNPLTNCT